MFKHGICLMLLAFALACAGAAPAQTAKKPDAAVAKIFDQLMNAIKDDDRKAFIAHGTDAVKEATTEEAFAGLRKHLSERLKNGYEAAYLCELKQMDHQIHLWKLTFKDGGDDLVIRIAFKDGKVGGFFLQ